MISPRGQALVEIAAPGRGAARGAPRASRAPPPGDLGAGAVRRFIDLDVLAVVIGSDLGHSDARPRGQALVEIGRGPFVGPSIATYSPS